MPKNIQTEGPEGQALERQMFPPTTETRVITLKVTAREAERLARGARVELTRMLDGYEERWSARLAPERP